MSCSNIHGQHGSWLGSQLDPLNQGIDKSAPLFLEQSLRLPNQ
jgi:hypothetical protein